MASLIRQTLSHVPHCTGGYNTKTRPYTLPRVDWAALGAHGFSRAAGSRTLCLPAADQYMLGLCAAKTTQEVQALGERAGQWRKDIWTLPADILDRLLQTAPPPDPIRFQGFGTHLLIRRLMELAPNGWVAQHAPEGAVSRLLDWDARWETGLGATAVDRLLSTLAHLRAWHPLLHRAGVVSRRAVEAELQARLDAIDKSAWTGLWTNTAGLPGADHVRLWVDLLRLPAISAMVLDHLLPILGVRVDNRAYTFLPLPHDPLPPEVISAMYAAMTARWSDTSHEAGGRSATRALGLWLDGWLSAGVPWAATREDDRWGKSTRLDGLEMGDRIRSALQQGSLNRKVRAAGQEPPPVRKRL